MTGTTQGSITARRGGAVDNGPHSHCVVTFELRVDVVAHEASDSLTGREKKNSKSCQNANLQLKAKTQPTLIHRAALHVVSLFSITREFHRSSRQIIRVDAGDVLLALLALAPRNPPHPPLVQPS